MLRLTVDYVKNRLQAIPKNVWTVEIIDNEACYVLRNNAYCQLFWMQIWHDKLATLFARQIHIKEFLAFDRERPVFVHTRTGQLMNLPNSLLSVIRYGSYDFDYRPRFFYFAKITSTTVLIAFTLIVCILTALRFGVVSKNKNIHNENVI